ncbi:Uncharacterized protein Adt_11066 [Abeliophyllum distichum]|uniref:Uncharacterized protein n=1 Tax=Abeliophyllum distichum TaxID=126358 RepID=A0ABD1UM70_9LAMI
MQPKWIKGDAPVLHLQNWRSRGRGHWCLALQRIPRRGRFIEDLSRAGNKEAAEASKVIEVDDAPEAEVPLSRKRKARPSGVGPSQATAEAGGDCRPAYGFQRTAPPKDGAQAVKYYFTPKWEEFSSHGELEDVLEASLASAIRASTLQMKVLGEFRTRMREQKKLVAQSSKADKEHQQALEGLKAALESARTAYEQMEADLKESDSNLLNMTKQLDNAAQKVAAEALEAANIEKKRLLEEAKSREE